MILGLILFILLAAIGFFHYIQGMLASAISAICAITAAMIAVGYQESIVSSIAKGSKYIDSANAIVLCATFAIVYIVLRVLVDLAVPGNVRVPVLLDKIGGGVLGVIVGLLATGVIAVAAQSLPFGPSIGGYTRFGLKGDQDIAYRKGNTQNDGRLMDMVDPEDLSGSSSGLFVPVDDLLIGLTKTMSDGSLSGAVSYRAAHPDLMQELFGNRIGVQVGAKRTAQNFGENDAVKNVRLYTRPSFPQKDGYQAVMHPGRSIGPTLKPEGDEILLVVRAIFSKDASDDDFLFRVSPGSVRLVAGGKNYFPVGTLDPDLSLVANRIDDPIFIDLKDKDRGADFVFRVKLGADQAVKGDSKKYTLVDDAFLEVKRYGRVDLGGKTIETSLTSANDVAVVRPTSLGARPEATRTEAPRPKSNSGVFGYTRRFVSAKLPERIQLGVPSNDASGSGLALGSATGNMTDLKGGKLDNLIINSTDNIVKLNQGGDRLLSEVYVPQGMELLQVEGRSVSSNPNSWEWAEKLSDFAIVDSSGKSHKAVGGWSRMRRAGAEFLFARYSSEGVIGKFEKQDMPSEVAWIVFLVPAGTKPKELQLNGAQVIMFSGN